MEWPEPTLNERARYILDGRVLARTVGRDLLALAVALLLGLPLFEITLVLVLDALARSVETPLRVRLARGRPRGAIASPMFGGTSSPRPLDHRDPRELARGVLLFSVFTVLLCGGALVAAVLTTRGTEGVAPLRALILWLIYTVPFFVYEHRRWLAEKRGQAVPHILARDLSPLTLFFSTMAVVLWGALPGVVAFVVLRAVNDSVSLVPSWSLDGVTWTTEWQRAWDDLESPGA